VLRRGGEFLEEKGVSLRVKVELPPLRRATRWEEERRERRRREEEEAMKAEEEGIEYLERAKGEEGGGKSV
jgi:hypothetical protein